MLETTWFVLWGVLWAVYFLLDGFDLGAATLMPFLSKNEKEKRTFYKALGPFWDGNEVWLITAGGVTFAAFPKTYAVMFSSLYSALMILLFSLILRGISLEFRGKGESPAWKKLWDTCLFVGSAIPAILFGVAFANIFRGIPIDAEGVYHGSLFTLFNPYGLIGGVLFLMLFLVHGANWLAIKTEGALKDRAVRTAGILWPVLLAVTVIFLIATWFSTRLFDNYLANPILFVLLFLAVAGLLMTRIFLSRGGWWKSWFSSGLAIVSCTLFGVVGLYPNMLPSSIDSAFHVTVQNSSSTPLTLKLMLGVALVMVPIVILYQFWAYRLFRHPITEEDLSADESY